MVHGGAGTGADTGGGDLERPATELEAEPSADDGPAVPYDRAIQKSVHNAYERAEPLLDQLVYHRVRSLELDIHTRREGANAPSGDWFVYHDDNPLMRNTSCARLTDCLGQLAAFHAAVPRHEVVTVFVDLKEPFGSGHLPEDLDDALAKGLGRENIVAPADVIARCPGASTVRDAVTGACAFPTLGALRGKFVIVTTGGTYCNADSLVARYGGDDPRARLAFVGPNVDGGCATESYDPRPDVVFFNMAFAERARASDIKSRGLVARVYKGGVPGGLNTAGDFAAARTSGAVHLATDKASFEQDGWAASHGPRGFPFTCEGCADDLVERDAVVGLRATSGDQWDGSDSAFFAYETDPLDATWSALVSVPSSHVQPFAKACLVARASDAADAANVAVCRAFDAHPPRAQVRAESGGPTVSRDASAFDGFTAETPAFLRLDVKSVGGGSEVTASASRDGRSWSAILTTTLSIPLRVRGATVSSHGPASVKGLFANLAKTQGGTITTMSTASLQQQALGAGAAGDAFDGVFPP